MNQKDQKISYKGNKLKQNKNKKQTTPPKKQTKNKPPMHKKTMRHIKGMHNN